MPMDSVGDTDGRRRDAPQPLTPQAALSVRVCYGQTRETSDRWTLVLTFLPFFAAFLAAFFSAFLMIFASFFCFI